MARYKYVGEISRVFPTLGITVKQGDEFDAPDNFVGVGVQPVANKKEKAAKAIKEEPTVEETQPESSAPSDLSSGE